MLVTQSAGGCAGLQAQATHLPGDHPPAASPAAVPAAAPGAGRAHRAGRLQDPALTETSALAVSPAGDRIVWALNDSGNRASLFALDATGAALGRVEVDAVNRDWEALDGGFIDGVATLVIGETGDNLRSHDAAALLLVAEPDLAVAPGAPASQPLAARRLDFRFDDGARDVEALALDDNIVWMLDKAPMTADGARVASGLYRLDLAGALVRIDGVTPVATRVASFLAPIGGLKARLAAALAGIDLGYPTGLDLDATRGHAWVLTYRDVLRYDRLGDEPWQDTLARAPAFVRAHGLPQAEALTILDDGTVLLTSEGLNARLIRTGDAR